jgi:DNA-binding transcriptional regulator GbsR (MarR family)
MDGSTAEAGLGPSERAASEAVGRLIEFWGFKRNMGRVWTLLYLSDRPLTAQDLRERLQISAGAVSMTITELLRWGVVKKVWIQGERRDHFVAEGQIWKMVSRVLRERELVEIQEAIAAFEHALAAARAHAASGDPRERARAEVQAARIAQLLELARLGHTLVDALVRTARIDATALARFLLGTRD